MEVMSSPFDYVKSINSGERIEIGTDYNQWLINEVLSYHPDCLLAVAEICNQKVSDEMHYDYLLATIKPRKRPYVKMAKKKRTAADVLLISDFYKYSIEKAKEALSVMTDEQLEAFKQELGIEA